MRVVVAEWERGVRYRHGRLLGVLGPGKHWTWRERIERVDLRQRVANVVGQELLTADGVPIRITVAIRWHVVEPVAYLQTATSAYEALYQDVQIGLRDVVGDLEAEALLSDRVAAGERLAELATAGAAALGIEVDLVAVKDIVFPGEVKRVFSQVAAAKQEARAAIERARGETAALRSLANAARVLDGNPALLHLRTIQAAGATVVVTPPPG